MNIYASFIEPGQFCRMILANGETSKEIYLTLDDWIHGAKFANIQTGEIITLSLDTQVEKISQADAAQFLLFNLGA